MAMVPCFDKNLVLLVDLNVSFSEPIMEFGRHRHEEVKAVRLLKDKVIICYEKETEVGWKRVFLLFLSVTDSTSSIL